MPQDVPVHRGPDVKFLSGEQVMIMRGPAESWISSIERVGIQVKVTNEFICELEDTKVITPNLAGQQAD